MKVSVIVPNYNHVHYLNVRIETILNQSFQDFELIILDDCSNDNSKKVIELYKNNPKVSKVLYNEVNSGSTFKQWKKGIQLSKGELIWIAESDDFAHPDFLQTAVEAFRQHESIALFYSDSNIIAKNNWRQATTFADYRNKKFNTDKWRSNHLTDGSKELNEWLKFHCTINNASAVVFKKDLALKVIDEVAQFKYSGDWVFYIKMAVLGDIYYCNKPLNNYSEHESNFSLQSFINVRQQKDFFKILVLLEKMPFVDDRKHLFKFFMTHYCDVGFQRFGTVAFLKLWISYIQIDFSLGIKAINYMILTRLKKILKSA